MFRKETTTFNDAIKSAMKVVKTTNYDAMVLRRLAKDNNWSVEAVGSCNDITNRARVRAIKDLKRVNRINPRTCKFITIVFATNGNYIIDLY